MVTTSRVGPLYGPARHFRFEAPGPAVWVRLARAHVEPTPQPVSNAGQRSSAQQIAERPGDHDGCALEVLQEKIFVGALGVGLQHGTWARAIEDDRYASFGIEARIGIERRGGDRDGLAQDRRGTRPQGLGQALVTWKRGQRARKQEPAHADADAGQALDRAPDHRLEALLDMAWILLWDHAPVEAQDHPVGHDVGVDAACNVANGERGVVYTGNGRPHGRGG